MKMLQKPRDQMISDLEDYWLKVQSDNPEESMDIPAAMEYYRSMFLEELIDEWQFLCSDKN